MEPIKAVKNRAYKLLEKLNASLEAGEIDEERWFKEGAAVITPAYLAGDNPRAQSGHSGDEAHWEQARSLIVDAIDRSGTFLDIGCASGHLMECVQRWAAKRGFIVEPYGLDIAPELAELARNRLPQWADRIFVGNALYWESPMRFDFVRTGLEYVPSRRQRDLVNHLLREVVAPGGRLIVGTYNEEREGVRVEPSQEMVVASETVVASWGFTIAGRSERRHYHDERLLYRVFWIDATDYRR
jgi:SAM-dependent methyltransferase